MKAATANITVAAFLCAAMGVSPPSIFRPSKSTPPFGAGRNTVSAEEC
jgi:hypothetical protein